MSSADGDLVLEDLLQEAVSAMQDCLAIYDEQGTLIFCNDSFRRVNRYTEAETVPGVATYDGLGELDRARTSDDRVPASFEERVASLKGDGQRRFIQQYEDRVYERSLSLTPSGGLISIMTEITQLKEAQHAAETANRAKSHFLACMSHELRTPLNAIVGFSQLIIEDVHGPTGEKKYQEYAQDIFRSGRHLISIIGDILDLSRVEAGEVAIQPVAFGLKQALVDAAKMVDFRLAANPDRLSIDVADDTPTLTADFRLFHQIMINLLSNAAKYTPEDGTIRIVARRTAVDAVVIEVQDTGVGIAAEDIEDALAPFGQVRSKPDIAHQGTGLGLSLAKSFMEASGGRLEIESTPDLGTTVRLTFPQDLDASRSAAARPLL